MVGYINVTCGLNIKVENQQQVDENISKRVLRETAPRKVRAHMPAARGQQGNILAQLELL